MRLYFGLFAFVIKSVEVQGVSFIFFQVISKIFFVKSNQVIASIEALEKCSIFP
jgi:hypothetical protein